MTRDIEQITKLAEDSWVYSHGSDYYDKQMWINGFIHGYINCRLDTIDNKIDSTHEKIAEILINTNEISYGKQS